MSNNQPLIVDLFGGCGGFSLGAALAGFRCAISIDCDPNLQSSYGRNFPNSRPILADVSKIDSAFWNHHLGEVRPAGVIGGPPCQGFSRIGKRDRSDPRNTLVAEFFRNVMMLRPKFFVMENVEGILDSNAAETLGAALDLVSATYCIHSPIVLNAANFGAATARSRVFIVGYDPAEMDSIPEIVDLPIHGHKPTVRDAIADLPGPVTQMRGEYGWANYPEKADGISEYAIASRSPPPEGLGDRDALERLARNQVSGLMSTKHSVELENRYRAVPVRKADPITKSVKLDWAGQCPTLRAGTGRERGAFQAVRPLHPEQARVITVREAARLQGFPDWFLFHCTKWHSFRMIGNSVSPKLAQAIMRPILTALA